MKLSVAVLGICITSGTTAFSPSTLLTHRAPTAAFQYEAITARPTPTTCTTSSNTRLSMVGGGMIERPPGGGDDSGDSGGSGGEPDDPSESSESTEEVS